MNVFGGPLTINDLENCSEQSPLIEKQSEGPFFRSQRPIPEVLQTYEADKKSKSTPQNQEKVYS